MALVTNLIAGSEARRVLLLAHGYGADERDLGGLLGYLDPEGIFATVMPRGPHAAPGAPGSRGTTWARRRRPTRSPRCSTRSTRPSTTRARSTGSRARKRSSAASRRAPGSRSRWRCDRATRRTRPVCSR